MSHNESTTIVVIGDVHGERERLGFTLDLVADVEPDLALLVGDVAVDPPRAALLRQARRSRHDSSFRRIVSTVGTRLRCPVVFVPGNHDLPDPCPSIEGINADGRIVEVCGLRIAGFGGAGPSRFGFPYEWSEQQAFATLQALLAGADVDILLGHTPPTGIGLDRTAGGAAVGSESVGEWIRRAALRLFVCGHIHEAWGVAHLAGVPCLNAGSLGRPFEQEIVWVIDWRDGPRGIRRLRVGEDGAAESVEVRV